MLLSIRLPSVLMMMLGFCLLFISGRQVWQTVGFLSRAAHARGEIMDAEAHPLVRFRDLQNHEIFFRQNGFTRKSVNTSVDVVYLTSDPGETAKVSGFLPIWGGAVWLLLPGLGFILLPLFGATFQVK